MRSRVFIVVVGLILGGLLCAPARAGSVIRIATAAPNGTAWSREFRAFARDVEALSGGEVQVKWYFSGLAGDELEVADRIARGQLDGTASAGMLCQRLAPTMRVFRMQGLFGNREEQTFVLTQLRGVIAEEFRRAGFVYLGGPDLGPDVLFTRSPVHTIAELRRQRLWRWDLDKVEILLSKEMGLRIVPTRLEDAAHAYDTGQLDGFIAIPSAALAFQWSARAHYFYNPRQTFMSGCLLVANRAFDRLSVADQGILQSAAAKAMIRVSDTIRQSDVLLLGTLFRKQGLRPMPVAPGFQQELDTLSHEVLARMGPQIVPAALLEHVRELIDMWRAQHPRQAR